ncbi:MULTISPECIES: polysaccharide deacetylase family protein [unclassified Clostridium]|uniref:polysaccharide deacetylase family protein n=1 Tax=unclassified Clostridium TaxID=2614128 RepID=UPI001D8ECC94|nr:MULTISPECIES: polysaccharide deacetylase family protein [unclassified Clostridium]MBN1046041.1 DUF2334 domain-containing protein [Clostridium botulinum]
MTKKPKKTLIYLILSIIIGVSAYCFISHSGIFKNKLTIINNKVHSNLLPTDNFNSIYTSNLKFDDMPIENVSDLTLNILDKTTIKNVPTLLKAQRYYFSIKSISQILGYSTDYSNNELKLVKDNNIIVIKNNTFEKNSTTFSLRGNSLIHNNETYISLSDIENIFDLIAVFDFDKKSISLLVNEITQPENSNIVFSSKVAMFRFEDFTCGDTNFSDKNQAKVKCMANLLYSEGVKFHVGWIPRFKAPTDNIDNDMLTNNSMYNVGFINLLDYLINKGAEIGLHGYTHQSGNDRSAVGEELSKDVNNSIEDTKKVIENGIDVASALNIPISFYESPHYRDTKLQKEVIEEYFQYIYEPYDNSTSYLHNNKKNNLYVPTPLGYVSDPNDLSPIINGLKKNDPKVLNSFFYHPSIELDYVDFKIDKDKLDVTYDTNSPLQQIVNALKENNYNTIHISELKK